jgi:hypothetical protein
MPVPTVLVAACIWAINTEIRGPPIVAGFLSA